MSENKSLLNSLMNLSLAIGIVMLAVKFYAVAVTRSAAILSDAAESVVHVAAVAFAAYSLRVARRRSDASHPFGYDRITFFSAGFEGAMIVAAAGFILYEAGRKFWEGPQLQEIGLGTVVESLVVVVNGALGLTLIVAGKRAGSLIVEADGRHVLTDSVTSLAVLAGLLFCLFGTNPWFDSRYFDPAFAVLAALNILWEGFKLVARSFGGLMDQVEDREQKAARHLLDEACRARGLDLHELRMRNSGNRYWFQFHLVFDDKALLAEAHRTATEIEALLRQAYPGAVITSHLEAHGDHDLVHGFHGEEV
jgi:cation diffusion facilitator family transporter